MVNISVDSSILIQNLRLGKELFFGILKKADLGDVCLIISSAVLMEIWSGKSMDNKVLVKKIENRLLAFKSIDINEEIAKKAGEIRRNYGVTGIEALIAATSIINDAELVTLNTKHFLGIKGLKLYNPSK